MAGKTDRFKLQWLDAGEHLDEDSYAFVLRDRHLIDRLLHYATEQHRHTGIAAPDNGPATGLDLTLSTVGGSIPAGQRARYVYTLIDENGMETGPSPEAYIDSADPIDAPASATLSRANTGVHNAGQFWYVLSAYQDVTTSETRAINPANITLPSGSNNSVTITLPSLPAGATGFNVYRRKPGGNKYFFLDQVDLDVATPPETYVDDGSQAEDCDRTLPQRNTTFTTNAVTVQIPDDVVPVGYTWKVYRTYTSGDYTSGTLAWVVEETSEGSGIIVPEFVDIGEGTTSGSPPPGGNEVGSPPKISFEDGAEVQGTLPPGRNVVPVQLTFTQTGIVDTLEPLVPDVWVCEYEQATIMSVRATLGRDSEPASSEVIVDVFRYEGDSATPTWDSIYDVTPPERPRVLVGETFGEPTVPDQRDLVAGDALNLQVVQEGGGATPTDENLTVTVYLLARGGADDTSHVF